MADMPGCMTRYGKTLMDASTLSMVAGVPAGEPRAAPVPESARALAAHGHARNDCAGAGPGHGFFTLELARLVGPAGRVWPSTYSRACWRAGPQAARAGWLSESTRAWRRMIGWERMIWKQRWIRARLRHGSRVAGPGGLLRRGGACFEVRRSGAGGRTRGHVTKEDFAKTLTLASQAGLSVASEPIIKSSRTALLRKR